MRYHINAHSDVGSRDINEDSISAVERADGFCVILADGLGGHGQGDVASQTVVRFVQEYYQEHGFDSDFFENVFTGANNALLAKQKISGIPGGMKTTLVVAAAEKGVLSWCHSGDSRFYLFRKGKLLRQSVDHSVPEVLYLSGDIRKKDIRNHPDRSKLLKCLGTVWITPQYEIGGSIPLQGGETVLLCSDGFWENILEREMAFTDLTVKDPAEKLSRMCNIVKKRGKGKKMDNNSAILVSINSISEG